MKKLKPFTLLILLHAVVLLIAVILLIRQKGEPSPDKEQIVVIPVEGIISTERGSLGRGISVDSLVQTINDLRDKDNVKAIVLRINSPGGSVGAVQEIHSALMKFRAKGKFIVSSFVDVAASGGYYIACAGDKIISQPGTLTGSIGVIMHLPNVQGLLGKIGVTMETVQSGSMKDAGSPFRKMTETEKRYFSTLIENAYSQFYQAVKEGRKMNDASLKPLADGRIFTGEIALGNHLVDSLGGIEEAVDAAKKLAGIETKKPQVIWHKERPSLDRLLDLFSISPLSKFTSAASAEPLLLYLIQ